MSHRFLARIRDATAALSDRDIARRLPHYVDPVRKPDDAEILTLSLSAARQLLLQADAHGVLPIALSNLRALRGTSEHAAAYSEAHSRCRLAMTQTAMLRRHCSSLLGALEGVPLAVLKGETFACKLYPDPALRPFTDVDLLTDPRAVPLLNAVLSSQGFEFYPQGNDRQREEYKWAHRDNPAIVVEVHTNLVHQPRLRATLSLTYGDIADGPDTAAALLAIAVLHGALHRFEKLRHVVDICQAARNLRGAHEETRFDRLVERTGIRFAAVVALDLAYRFMEEPRCRDLAAALGPVHLRRLARLLVSRSSIMSTMTASRHLHSWRRQTFRLLLAAGRGSQAVVHTPIAARGSESRFKKAKSRSLR